MSYFIDFSGTHFMTDNGSIVYRRKQDGQDGHGGHSEEHRREMEQIADAIAQKRIAEIIPEIRRNTAEQTYNNLLEALSFDITSAVRIGFENGEDIFRDSKTQEIVANAITREIRKQLQRYK